jgi:hypothetical protein
LKEFNRRALARNLTNSAALPWFSIFFLFFFLAFTQTAKVIRQPVALVDFMHIHRKNPDYPACANLWFDRSLQSIKIHFREFLYGFMREAQQTPG